MSNEMPDFLSELFGKQFGYSESDVISMYIDGKISKEEYIERMNSLRNSSK
jgi:hypothetical protein